MKSRGIMEFEMRVQRIIEWSSIDPKTREVLRSLMDEVSNLAEKLAPKK